MQFNIKRVAREWKEREREERGRETERQRETEAKFTGKIHRKRQVPGSLFK